MRYRFQFLALLFIFHGDCAIVHRSKRTVAVGSNSETNGDGDDVITDANTSHFKTSNGIPAMNVTAVGNATGAGMARIANSGGGFVGNNSAENIASVMSVGDKANSYSDIFAAVEGENLSTVFKQQGKVAGQGATLSNVNGGSTLQNNGEKKSGFSYGNAGGTGSIKTESEVLTNQEMTWNQLMAKLSGTAMASGDGSAQSNIDLGTGLNDNNMTISGLVSGINSDKGLVNSLVIGNGTIDGNQRNIVGMMVGSVNGKGNSTIVGASSIDSNQTSSAEIQAFGNSNVYSSGNSSVNLLSNTNIENDNGVGVVHISGKGLGSSNSIVASNGIKKEDNTEDAAFLGSGSIRGFGSDVNSNASQSVDTAADPSGNVKIQSISNGNSASNDGTNSSLAFNSNGLVGGWQNSSFSVIANGYGIANGATSNVSGTGFVNLDGDSLNGNSSMTAIGRGNGSSGAESRAILDLNEEGVHRNGTVIGSAIAIGKDTDSESTSLISNDEGVQTMTNVQHVKSSGSGSSSVSASSHSIFKRKKRFTVLDKILRK